MQRILVDPQTDTVIVLTSTARIVETDMRPYQAHTVAELWDAQTILDHAHNSKGLNWTVKDIP